MKKFLIRWFVCSSGLWLTARLLGGNGIDYESQLRVIIVAGLFLALVNIIIRPVVVILSLPAILLTLGLFMIVVNGLMVLLVGWLYRPLHISNVWAAMLAGIVIGLVNYLVSAILERKER